MNKRVYNSTFGKLGRTLGFLLVLAASVFVVTYLVLQNSTIPFADTLTPIAESIDDILQTLPAVLADYVSLALVLGLIFITWAIRKGLILRLLITILLVAGYLGSAIEETSALAFISLNNPGWLQTVLDMIEPLYDQVVAVSEYIIPGIMVLTPMFLWGLFANKKPGRFSVLMLRLGSITLFLGVLFLQAGVLFLTDLAAENWYLTAELVLYLLTYVLFIVGGLFGVLGFSRK